MEQLQVNPTAEDTIIAVSTPNGVGGIAVIRISGPDALAIADSAWKGKSLADAATHTAHLGKLFSTDGEMLDEAVATVFRAPASFTGEDVVELSVHGSRWIQREVLADFVRRGLRVAEPGEFTKRAFLNGKIDLAQAEGVADLIASSSRASHHLAISQARGRFSREFVALRDKLVEFASLLELELDFSEEEVEFADRQHLLDLANEIVAKLKRLSASYSTGSVIKDGVPVVIAGIPNAGKSSVLNLLLSDDKAIVSDIPGTTRDTIEDSIELDGILYRFIDTAGLRDTTDAIEGLGIDRARQKMRQARIVIWVLDPTADLEPQYAELKTFHDECPDKKIILLINKSDFLTTAPEPQPSTPSPRLLAPVSRLSAPDTRLQTHELCEASIPFSATTGLGLDALIRELTDLALDGHDPSTETIVTNARHFESILQGISALKRAIDGINAGISGDFIAQDVREAIHHLSSITGTISSATLLHSIFSRFCIGK